jgi:predicted nucleic acid-binding protein
MRVVVDTCVWSLALARQTPRETPAVVTLRRLVEEGDDIIVPGIVLQELLQGLRSDSAEARLRSVLEPFELVAGDANAFAQGAAIHRACRSKGLVIATVGALIAAIALRRGAALLTTDGDVQRLADVVPLRLLPV